LHVPSKEKFVPYELKPGHHTPPTPTQLEQELWYV